MSNVVDLKCSCGLVEGKLEVVTGSFFHVVCLCSDCQTFATQLGNSDKILDKHGGTELFQTYPAFMQITEGQDKISCLKLNETGLYRWYTSCCNMPLANTMSSAKVPFVGISVALMKLDDQQEKDNILGPITMKAFGKDSIGEMPKDAHPKFPITYMPKILTFMIKGMLANKNTPSPFFHGKKPVSDIYTVN